MNGKYKKQIRVVIVFFAILLLGTIVSRATSSMLTPKVETQCVSGGKIEHNLLLDVTVSGEIEEPVYVCSGILVEEIYVSQGKLVKKGDKLLRLNTDNLQDVYLSKKLERKDMKLQSWYSSDEKRMIDERRLSRADQELSQLEILLAQDGILYADFGGMVSEVRQTVGCKSMEDAVFVLIRETHSYCLKSSITEKQKEDIVVGDRAVVQMGDVSVISEVSAVYEEISNPQHYIVEVMVSGEDFHIGDSVLVNITHMSKNFDFLIPVSAIRSDTSSTYVLVMREKETMLGTENVASKVQVKVGKTNAEYAGANSEALTGTDKVIVFSDKPIQAGDTVREK